MNKSKSVVAIFLIGLFSLSIIASGCSKDTSKISSDTVNQNSIDNQVVTQDEADLATDEELVDADIGELDDLEVSDEIPIN